jgi:hypothetical protein
VLVHQQVVLPDALHAVAVRLRQLSFTVGHSKLPLALVYCVVRPHHLTIAMSLVLEEPAFVTSTRRPFLIARTLGLPLNQVSGVVYFFHQFAVGRNDLWNQPVSFTMHFPLYEVSIIPLTAWQAQRPITIWEIVAVVTNILGAISLGLLPCTMFFTALEPPFIDSFTLSAHDPVAMRLIVEPEACIAKRRSFSHENSITVFESLKPLTTVLFPGRLINEFAFAMSSVLLVLTDIKRAA